MTCSTKQYSHVPVFCLNGTTNNATQRHISNSAFYEQTATKEQITFWQTGLVLNELTCKIQNDVYMNI